MSFSFDAFSFMSGPKDNKFDTFRKAVIESFNCGSRNHDIVRKSIKARSLATNVNCYLIKLRCCVYARAVHGLQLVNIIIIT